MSSLSIFDVSMNSSSVEELLTSLTKLQDMEKELYDKLEAGDIPTSDYEKTFARINELAAMREALVRNIGLLYERSQQAVNSARVDLTSQITFANIINKELETARKRVDDLQGSRLNKMRMVEINDYFGKRYKASTNVLQMIVYICIPLLLLAILRKSMVIPMAMADALTGTILAVGLFLVARKLWDYFVRNNMNFDEYNWSFDSPENVHPTKWEYNKKNLVPIDLGLAKVVQAIGLDCYGAQCCAANMHYNQERRVCEADDVKTETFVSGDLPPCATLPNGRKIVPYNQGTELSMRGAFSALA